MKPIMEDEDFSLSQIANMVQVGYGESEVEDLFGRLSHQEQVVVFDILLEVYKSECEVAECILWALETVQKIPIQILRRLATEVEHNKYLFYVSSECISRIGYGAIDITTDISSLKIHSDHINNDWIRVISDGDKQLMYNIWYAIVNNPHLITMRQLFDEALSSEVYLHGEIIQILTFGDLRFTKVKVSEVVTSDQMKDVYQLYQGNPKSQRPSLLTLALKYASCDGFKHTILSMRVFQRYIDGDMTITNAEGDNISIEIAMGHGDVIDIAKDIPKSRLTPGLLTQILINADPLSATTLDSTEYIRLLNIDDLNPNILVSGMVNVYKAILDNPVLHTIKEYRPMLKTMLRRAINAFDLKRIFKEYPHLYDLIDYTFLNASEVSKMVADLPDVIYFVPERYYSLPDVEAAVRCGIIDKRFMEIKPSLVGISRDIDADIFQTYPHLILKKSYTWDK